MRASSRAIASSAVFLTTAMTTTAHGATFAEYLNKMAWQEAVGQWTTIGFADLQLGTIVTDQYRALGATFTEGDDSIYTTSSFLEDGYGLRGSSGLEKDDSITVEFESPMHWIGVDYPGYLQIDLYFADTLLYSTSRLDGGGDGFFGGVISSQPFDRVVLFDPFGSVVIDDLHFGGVPAPGALPLLGALLLHSRRRRS